MISEGYGNLLEADVDALVNTVDTVGVMGKGVALQFRRAFPSMFEDYARAAKAACVELGQMHVWPTGALNLPRYVINFPTKDHWRARSKLADIDSGLRDLVRVIRKYEISLIAIPPLGCGNGGLAWREVEPRIRAALSEVPEVDAVLYPPAAAPPAAEMRAATSPPVMTVDRCALIHLLQRYTERTVEFSLVEVQKLLYFLQEAGEPLRLNFVQGRYGPYADKVRHVLTQLEGHYLSGFGDGDSPVQHAEPIRVLPGADAASMEQLQAHPATGERIDTVLSLTQGFRVRLRDGAAGKRALGRRTGSSRGRGRPGHGSSARAGVETAQGTYVYPRACAGGLADAWRSRLAASPSARLLSTVPAARHRPVVDRAGSHLGERAGDLVGDKLGADRRDTGPSRHALAARRGWAKVDIVLCAVTCWIVVALRDVGELGSHDAEHLRGWLGGFRCRR